ncbi:MAG: hypothetical protein KDD69_02275 [Bdellovibrionales bacterium]|nr:hypothetical protein [Bdellovibrionales bacterium]
MAEDSLPRAGKTDLYLPPSIPEAMPPSEEALLALLEREDGDREAVLFALGCWHVRRGELEAGIARFEELYQQSPSNAEIACNLGFAYFLHDEAERALTMFKKALVQDSSLVLPLKHAAKAYRVLGKRDEAIAALERLTKMVTDDAEAFESLGELYEEDGSESQAIRAYEQALSVDPGSHGALQRLTQFAFNRGYATFVDGKYDDAFRIWSAAYARHARGFSANQHIVQALDHLRSEFRAQGTLQHLRERFLATKTPGDCYELFSALLFQEGLVPEQYVSRDELGPVQERWRSAGESSDGVLPYPHYRLGVAQCLAMELEAGLESLRLARDHLPPSKHRPLRLDSLIQFVKELIGAPTDETSDVEQASDAEWEAAGFTDPFQKQVWRKTRLLPNAARQWRAAGFSAQAAERWAAQKLDAQTAELWRGAGFSEPASVKRWVRGGCGPQEATAWSGVVGDRIDLALQCRQAGLLDPFEAKAWLVHFMFPSEAAAWKSQGFSPDEAADWLGKGVKDPFLARQAADGLN